MSTGFSVVVTRCSRSSVPLSADFNRIRARSRSRAAAAASLEIDAICLSLSSVDDTTEAAALLGEGSSEVSLHCTRGLPIVLSAKKNHTDQQNEVVERRPRLDEEEEDCCPSPALNHDGGAAAAIDPSSTRSVRVVGMDHQPVDRAS